MALLKSTLSKEFRLEMAKKYGHEIAGPDDPVYSEGSSITFLPPTLQGSKSKASTSTTTTGNESSAPASKKPNT
jgi:hypothetical protein